MTSPIAWDRVETALLDMDGTLLDLAFDNFFWRELIPQEFARQQGLAAEDAREQVLARYEERAGTLDWYCLDHWEQAFGLDLVALKRKHLAGIRLLPGVETFLAALAQAGLRRVIATNAHGTTLALKLGQTGLEALVDEVHSSHHLGAAKEEQAFWSRFREQLAFEPAAAVLIDDNIAVLDAASEFGIGQCLAISQPDSTRPPGETTDCSHPVAVGVAALIPQVLAVARGNRPKRA
ncbi:MAG: GMP/IMP nucleotidase [Pseudomonadota bacterium]